MSAGSPTPGSIRSLNSSIWPVLPIAEVEHLADDVIVIDEGHMITRGSLVDLQQAASLARTADADQLAAVVEQAGATAQITPDGVVIQGIPIDEIGERAFTAGIVLHELSPRAGSLEELFLAWTTNPTSTGEAVQPELRPTSSRSWDSQPTRS